MASLGLIASVLISRETAGVTQAGFGTPLIIGFSAKLPLNTVRPYNELAEVLEDFASSDPEYKAAQKAFAQTPRPPQVKIGRGSALVAKVLTLTPDVTLQEVQTYQLEINGEVFSFESDASPTASEVVTGLIAAINGGQDKVTASGTTTLIITADNAGENFEYNGLSSNLTETSVVENVGYPEIIAGLSDIDNDWYGLTVCNHTQWAIMAIAGYIEGTNKMYGVSIKEADAKDAASTTDTAALLKTANYFRTWCFFSEDADEYPEAALFARVLPLTPGSETWANKTLAAVPADPLKAGEIAALRAKNCNFYVTIAGKSITLDGKTAGGEWIDVMRFVDWVQARMGEGLVSAITRMDKVPFTDGGIGTLDAVVRSVLETGQDNGGIAPTTTDDEDNVIPGFTTTFPRAYAVDFNSKAQRKVSGKFRAILAGAIHFVEIQGVVTL